MKRSFKRIIENLEDQYGTPRAPLSDPLQIILWENLGYLIPDEKRSAAFQRLRKEVGLQPGAILSAPGDKLLEIAKLGGAQPQTRAQRLREIALIVMNDFEGSLDPVMELPLPKAIKALKKFPAIGEPGAEKILLFSKAYPVLALDSNGLRVLLRLGFGEEKKDYTASYRSVREAINKQAGNDFDFLIRAHQLLRLHGKTLCKTSKPFCFECPVAKYCAYFAEHY
ncbi:MAG TPA: hypothetical protein VGN86_03135 [Pyrinomonadaceae bacterium]|nr:hypothetical protein [Pyrinomonadaceae bacterium]